MSVVKRMFRQNSARVASSPAANSLSQQASVANEADADEEEEKCVISAADDTALILCRRQRVIRRPPLHSNSLACIFSDRTSAAIAKGLGKQHLSEQTESTPAIDTGSTKHQGLSPRAASPPGRVTSPVRQVSTVAVTKLRRAYSRTPTYHSFAHIGLPIDGFRLTTQQRSLIQQCWTASKRKDKSGDSAGSFVFRWVFKKEPCIKAAFGLEGVADDLLVDDPGFQKHAQTLSDVLELVVDSVGVEQDSSGLLDDTMGPFLCSYGAEHAQAERNAGSGHETRIRPSDWELFASAIKEFAMESWRSGASWSALGPFQKRNEALHAWHVLVHFIVTKVRRGYELEKERLLLAPKRSAAGDTSVAAPAEA